MLNAILVCVDYADYLAITLPWNRHHFQRVVVVTAPHDQETLRVCAEHWATPFVTDALYDDGATFNKWKALEQGLDVLGRSGWLCIMDADVLWPQSLGNWERRIGRLYTPWRRMCEDLSRPIPPESEWTNFPRHRQCREFAGYSQIFHAADPALGPAPWHQTDWRHAGGADSFFQAKWHTAHKIRPAWECLHLGPAGQNWCGRSSPYLDGRSDPQAQQRRQQLEQFMATRRQTGNFNHERIG